jgi:hypothetical protein
MENLQAEVKGQRLASSIFRKERSSHSVVLKQRRLGQKTILPHKEKKGCHMEIGGLFMRLFGG